MNTAVYRVLKMLIIQFLLISVCVLLGMGLMSVVTNNHNPWPWYYPFEVLAISVATAIPSLVYISKNELSKNQFIIRAIIHFVLLIGIVLGMGYWFSWWTQFSGIIIVLSVFIVIYVFVFLITYLTDKNESNKINEALKNINHDEE